MKIGDKVKKWKSPTDIGKKAKLGKEIWTVTKVVENAISESGILLDVEIPPCPHCGAKVRRIYGYDSHWFIKV